MDVHLTASHRIVQSAAAGCILEQLSSMAVLEMSATFFERFAWGRQVALLLLRCHEINHGNCRTSPSCTKQSLRLIAMAKGSNLYV